MHAKSLVTLLALTVFAALPASAEEVTQATDGVRAAGPRAPLKTADARGTALKLDRYHNEVTVVRTRTEGKAFATFVAEPRLLDRGAIVVFEIRSVAKTGVIPRWRCIAQDDVAECLGAPLRLRYLPDDEKIVLTARLRPASDLDKMMQLASR